MLNCFALFSVSDENERRLHTLATETKNISKQLVDEMSIRRKDLSRVREILNEILFIQESCLLVIDC
jgi:hypothetical protein